MTAASAGSSVVSRRTPRSARPTRPPALMRGPSAKPRSEQPTGLVSPAASASAASPGLPRPRKTFSPCATKARFSPLSCATSATVPSATRSSSGSSEGSSRLANQPRARRVRIRAAASRKHTPTAARWPCPAPSSHSSSRLGFTSAWATGSRLAHLWWSTTTTASPAAAAASSASNACAPQSTVTHSVAPSTAIRSSAGPDGP